MRKILPYLILNFFVSALAVTLVLLVWERTHQTNLTQNQAGSSPTASQEIPFLTNNQLPPLDVSTIEIKGIIGAGDLDTERLQLANVSDLNIDLLGWKIVDEDRNELTLPALTIFPGGAVSLHSKGGVDTAVELFGNQPMALFTSGEKVKLLDPEGRLRSSYVVP